MPLQILIVKTGTTIQSLLERGEDFEHWFRQGLGLADEELLVCRIDKGDSLPDLKAVDGILVTGSPAFLTDLAPWNFKAADYLRAAHDQAKPILGVCYGHQLLAWAFGGSVEFNPRGREIGTVAIELSGAAASDELFAEFPQQLDVQVSHLQSVLQLPEEAALLAGNSFDPHHGFRLGETSWGLQFHPEFNAGITRAYIRERSAEIVAEGQDPAVLLESVRETEKARELLSRFVKVVTQRRKSA